LDLQDQLLRKSKKVLIKFSPFLDISVLARELNKASKIWIVAYQNECKEVLCLLESEIKDLAINAVNITNDDTVHFKFDVAEEKASEAKFSKPSKFLYEPNSAILKAGAFKLLTNRFDLNKLHPSSHLYTNDHLVKDFPGRKFLIRDVIKPSKKELKRAIGIGKASLSIRNFPMTVAQLKKKLGLSDGGNLYLFATTLLDGSRVLIVCEKIK